MKKFSIIALTLILAAGLMTACTAPSNDETTGPSTGTTSPSTSATTPSTAATTPSTAATTPSTAATTPSTSAPITIPAPTGAGDATEGTGGVNSMDPSGSMAGENGRMPFGR